MTGTTVGRGDGCARDGVDVATGGGGGVAGGRDVHCTSTAPAIASVEKTAVRGGFARPTRIPPTLPRRYPGRLALWRGNATAAHAWDAATRAAWPGDPARAAGDGARRTARSGHSARSARDCTGRALRSGDSARSTWDRACRAFRSGATRAGEVITARRTARREDDRRGKAGRSGSYCGGGRTSKKHRREFLRIDQHVGGCTSTGAARNFPRASKCYRTVK